MKIIRRIPVISEEGVADELIEWGSDHDVSGLSGRASVSGMKELKAKGSGKRAQEIEPGVFKLSDGTLLHALP